MANNESLTEYRALVAKSQHPFTHHGDNDLSPQFREALIRAEARGSDADAIDLAAQAQKDAEAIAIYIIDIPATLLTQVSQDDVKAKLSLAQLTDEVLQEQSINREDVTLALQQANQKYFDDQRWERLAHIQVMSIF